MVRRSRTDETRALHVASGCAASLLLGVTCVALTFDSSDPMTAAGYYSVMLASRLVRIVIPAACVLVLVDSVQNWRSGDKAARRHGVQSATLLFSSLAVMLIYVKPAELKLVASGGRAPEDSAHLHAAWAGHLVVCCIQLVALRLHIGALVSPQGPWAIVRS